MFLQRWPLWYRSSQLKHNPLARRSSISVLDNKRICGVVGLGEGGAGKARRGCEGCWIRRGCGGGLDNGGGMDLG